MQIPTSVTESERAIARVIDVPVPGDRPEPGDAHAVPTTAFLEAYVGWLPFVAEYMDHAYRVHRYWNDLGLREPPSAYLSRQVYATFIEDAVGLRERHVLGVDNLMWSSDYPHGESTFPEGRAFVARQFADVPADETRKMVFENARRVYRV